MTLGSIETELRAVANPEKAVALSGFFKTGKGEYGEGDVFLGIMVPQTRAIAKKYKLLPFKDIEDLLASHYHEFRLCALLILVQRFEQEADDRQKIYEFYLTHTDRINNWDLVDVTCPNIIGNYLLDKQRKKLYELARSKDLWERRIAIVSTYAFIKEQQYADTTAISEILLQDKHDLIHKASGWMLREVGKRNKTVLESFLRRHASVMPRTMLRYAIEKFSVKERKYWMNVGKGKEAAPTIPTFSHKTSVLFERMKRK